MVRAGRTDGLHITSSSTPALLLILLPYSIPRDPQHLEAADSPPQDSLVVDSPVEVAEAGNDGLSGIAWQFFLVENQKNFKNFEKCPLLPLSGTSFYGYGFNGGTK